MSSTKKIILRGSIAGQSGIHSRCRELAFSIEEIGCLLRLCEGSDCTCQTIRDLTLKLFDDIKSNIRDLQRMEKSLLRMVSGCDESMKPDCRIMNFLAEPADKRDLVLAR